jgi:ABC-type molybdenum transport system ATPase subunit/photorepair protein PhrA
MVDEAPRTEARVQAPPERSDDHPLLPLVARRLHFGINGRTIIKDVSFWIGSSGRTVILGPNGAGKSVMLPAGRYAGESFPLSRRVSNRPWQRSILCCCVAP